jgi:cytochrome c oxidase subunit 2
MEIHKFEKLWLVAALVLIVGFIATVTYGAVGAGIEMVDDEGGTVDAEAIQNNEYGSQPNFKEPGVYQTGQNEYDVYVVSQQFLFKPGTSSPITLPAGSTVTFYITSADVIHGFEVAGTNVNAMAVPGQVAQITVEFEETGQYGIVCNEYCGAGHHTMEGSIEVVPQSEYDGGQ